MTAIILQLLWNQHTVQVNLGSVRCPYISALFIVITSFSGYMRIYAW